MASKEEATAILKTGYGKELLFAAGDYVAPFFWGTPPKLNTTPKIRHGSIFFLDCGNGSFAITAAHVYKEYLQNKSEDGSITAQLANLLFLPEDRLIDCSDEIDLATFRIDEGEIKAIKKNVHLAPANTWPPEPPKPNQGVFFAGFPAADRSERDWKSFDFGMHAGLLTVSTVDDRKIICQFTREDWVDVHGLGFPPEFGWMGGFSGAALWTLVEKPFVTWRLAGIITEFHQSFELLYVTRPDFIQPDGTLLHRRTV